MFIVLTILLILSFVVTLKRADEEDVFEVFCCCFVIILTIINTIIGGIIISKFGGGVLAKPKIEMYEEENKRIEEQIDVLVKQYMEYEGKTFGDLKGESVITLVSLYPELKTDSLVSKQIEIYINNNNKIKELKEKEIELKIGKWLLYFGK